MAHVSDDDVEMVKAATGLTDAYNGIIRNALQGGLSANDAVDEFWVKGMEEVCATIPLPPFPQHTGVLDEYLQVD